MSQASEPQNVGILILARVEILDFRGPFEVFAISTLPSATDGGSKP